MKSSIQLSAVLLRNVLIASIALFVIIGVGGFVFLNQQLASYAGTVASDKVKASNGSQEIAQLQQLKSAMEESKVAVTRAASIVSDSKYYEYQDKIIDDITSYAEAAGLEVQSLSFNDASPTGVAAAPGTAAPKTPAGLKVSYATVTLSEKNITYKSIMTFLKSIEQNLTKMEVTGVSFTVNSTNGQVSTQPITIGVYTR